MLKNQDVRLVSAVGSGATSTASWDVLRCLSVIDSDHSSVDDLIYFIDVDSGSDDARSNELHGSPIIAKSADGIKASISARILSGTEDTIPLLSKYADSFQGIKTGDDAQLRMEFWEVPLDEPRWQPLQSSVTTTRLVGGLSSVVDMSLDGARLARKQGLSGWGKPGVVASQMRDLAASFYWGTPFDSNVSAIVPRDRSTSLALWAYCSSDEYSKNVRKIDKSLATPNGAMAQVPFDYSRWEKIGQESIGTEIPLPDSDDPTQWFFHGSPKGTTKALQVGTALVAGYRWPTAVRDIELSIRVADFLRWSKAATALADSEGIVCLAPIRGEGSAAERLSALLASSFSNDWSAAKLATLLVDAGYGGKSLDDWLHDGFFGQHCELFHQRPFLWHVWDGRRDGFHALLNYHRLAAPNGEGRRTLEKLIYSCLGDWIDRQRTDQRAGIEGADARLAHADHLKTELIKILEGEPPYDIFVRWKPLHEQPLGWDPDINDGVRINIRPFLTARTLNARGGNACILRATPKIKGGKDRGKEPTRDKNEYPWFWGWDKLTADFAGSEAFDGNRWNDLHYSRALKQSARNAFSAKAGDNG